jgi:PST family polysaccharide transporter
MAPDSAPDSDFDPGRNRASFNTALGWSYVMHGGQYAITTVITFVLAAIVGPSAFGLVAMAMVYLVFIQMLVRQGMVPALVQRQQLEQTHVNSAFWLIAATGVVLTAVSLLLSSWWAQVNRTPDLEPVINALSVVILLQALAVVPEALFSRRMDFRSLAMRTNSAALVGGVVGLAMALTGFGVWALVAQHIVKATVDLIVLWRMTDWRPTLAFDWPASRQLLGFSLSTTIAGFGDFVTNRADALLMGLFFGPTAVGLYRLAARVVDLIVDVTVRSFHSVSLPELSRLQDDGPRFADRITRMISSTGLIALPLLAIVAGASELLMAVIGEEWAAAAAPLSVLCIAGAVTVLTMFAGPVAMAVGKPHVLAIVMWVSAAISAVSLVIAGFLLMEATVEVQVLGMAVAKVALFSSAALVLAGWVISKNSECSVWSLVKAVAPASLVGALVYATTRLVAGLTWPGGVVFHTVLVVVTGAVVAAGLVLKVDPGLRSWAALNFGKLLGGRLGRRFGQKAET